MYSRGGGRQLRRRYIICVGLLIEKRGGRNEAVRGMSSTGWVGTVIALLSECAIGLRGVVKVLLSLVHQGILVRWMYE